MKVGNCFDYILFTFFVLRHNGANKRGNDNAMEHDGSTSELGKPSPRPHRQAKAYGRAGSCKEMTIGQSPFFAGERPSSSFLATLAAVHGARRRVGGSEQPDQEDEQNHRGREG